MQQCKTYMHDMGCVEVLADSMLRCDRICYKLLLATFRFINKNAVIGLL